MSEEFDDDAQDIPAAAPRSHLINPKLIVVLVVLVPLILNLVVSAYFSDTHTHISMQAIFCGICMWAKWKHDQSIASVSA
jgi:hypothetical protein